MSRIRLTVVMTHPVQYLAPWFRYIHAYASDIDLTVLYASAPTPKQQGAGFGQAFAWDIDLLAGYRSRVVRPPRENDDVHSDSFWGLDVPELSNALADSRPEIVLLMGWHSSTLVRVLIDCRRRGIPVLYRGDTNLNNAPRGIKNIFWQLRTRALLAQFSGFLAVGTRAATYLRHFGARADQIFSSPHAVDNDFFAAAALPHQTPAARIAARAHFNLSPAAFVPLFVGKIEPKKRLQDCISALPPVGAQVELLVIGSGELLTQCRAQAATLRVQPRWVGFQNQQELGRAYAAADCLVLPSDAGETWGLVVNEALATGLPCVVSDKVGCGPDLIDTQATGEQFPLGNVGELVGALTRIKDRKQRGHDYAPACRKKIATHSFANATTGLTAACRALSRNLP